MKQTAVEWLENKIEDQRENGNDDLRTTLHYCKQAKEMEKEQSDDYAIEFAKFISNEDYDLDYWVNNSDIKTLLEIFKNK